MSLSCFKAYDIRGRLGDEITEELAYKLGRAYGQIYKPQKIVVGADVRLSSEPLKKALALGLNHAGVDVLDLGLTGTEEVYFSAFYLDVQGGIQVTASHNPIDYNGFKLVRDGARPISGDTGLREIESLVEAGQFDDVEEKGVTTTYNIVPEYISHLLTYIDIKKIKPLKLVVNAGNGAAGHVIDALESKCQKLSIPLTFIKICNDPDGTFPHGIPNPLLIENRTITSEAVIKYNADMGIAWDGDFDRCFLFDENGEFIEGYYIVGLLAQAFLMKSSGEKIVHDPRLVWNTQEIIQKYDGIAVQSKTGHAFIKERMRIENAIYGGEMSAHHYFRDFAYCDSGMIPWLLVTMLLSETQQNLSTLVENMIAKFPCSGEINFTVADTKATIEKIVNHYKPKNPVIDTTDGFGLDFGEWRFNIRASNTEPLLRLNIETKASLNPLPMQHYIDELQTVLLNITPN